VSVSVIDEGRPVRRLLPGGHGLAGIRERVSALGGTLDAGPTDDGRHLIHVTLPTASA
jgi:signal transduction histidine kinase